MSKTLIITTNNKRKHLFTEMKKVIYLLAIVVMIGSVVFAVLNRQHLLNVYLKIDQVEKRTRIVTTDLGEKEDVQDQLVNQELESKDSKQQREAKLAATRNQLTIVNRKITEQKRLIEMAEIEILEYRQLIKLHFPNGGYRTPEQLDSIYQANLAKQSTLNEYLQRLEGDIDSISNQNKLQRAKIGEEETIQLEKQRKVLLGELQARVIAINSDYGFVMVNAGSAHGIDSKQTFLVKNGNKRVGRLRIAYITDKVCLCDIVSESKQQTRISVGDYAIIESPLASVNHSPSIPSSYPK